MEPEQKVHPIWKDAASKVVEQFKEGDMISMDWLHRHFDIQKPEVCSFDAFQKYQFELMAATDGFKNELLEVYQIAIANVRGEGYRILPPNQQTGYAEKKFLGDIGKSVRKAASILSNINFDRLDDKERKENADAKGRIAAIFTMSKKQKVIAR